jgi:hypothetical protein
MITGAHFIIYSTNPEKDRAFIRDILKFPYVDAGEGWLIFGLPPAEVAIHPSNENGMQEFYLMCDNIGELLAQMKILKVKCSKVHKLRWGLLTKLKLPGGGYLGIYQPFHARPKSMKVKVPGIKAVYRLTAVSRGKAQEDQKEQ